MKQRSLGDLVEQSRPLLLAMYGRQDHWTRDGGYATPAEWLAVLVESLYEELPSLEGLPAAAKFAFVDTVELGEPATETLARPYANAVLSAFVGRLEELDRTTPDEVKMLFQSLRSSFKERLDLRGRDVMFTIRSALTGVVQGPCLEVVVSLLGRRRCLDRVRRQLNALLEAQGDTIRI